MLNDDVFMGLNYMQMLIISNIKVFFDTDRQYSAFFGFFQIQHSLANCHIIIQWTKTYLD